MKKILEVLQYGETDIRFNTDIQIEKNPDILTGITTQTAFAMATKLWGGNELSILAVIRALAIADLSLCVNRKQMVRQMDEMSANLARSFRETTEMMRKEGYKIQTFSPLIRPSKTKS